jgi:hypothetical protein
MADLYPNQESVRADFGPNQEIVMVNVAANK